MPSRHSSRHRSHRSSHGSSHGSSYHSSRRSSRGSSHGSSRRSSHHSSRRSSRGRSRNGRNFHRQKPKSYTNIFKMLKTLVDKNKQVDVGSIRQSSRSAGSDSSVKKMAFDLETSALNLAEMNKSVEEAEIAMAELMKHKPLVDPAQFDTYLEQQRQMLLARLEQSKLAAARVHHDYNSMKPKSITPESAGYIARLKQGVKDIYNNHGKSIATAAVILGAAAAIYYGMPAAGPTLPLTNAQIANLPSPIDLNSAAEVARLNAQIANLPSPIDLNSAAEVARLNAQQAATAALKTQYNPIELAAAPKFEAALLPIKQAYWTPATIRAAAIKKAAELAAK